jgi:PAS domain S-box-containing protein
MIYSSDPDAFDDSETSFLMELAGDMAYGIAALRTKAEKKRAKDEANISAAHIHYLSKYANDFIILLDKDFRFLEVNDRVVDFYGYTRDELIGMHASQLRAPATKENFINQIELAQVSGKALYETVHQRKDGSNFPVEISLRAIDNDGQRFYQAVIRDITERKHAEAEIEKYNKHLEDMVRERTAELSVAKERAESADRLKSAFLAAMSHELRTPLNSIIGFTGMVLQGLAGPINKEQEKQLGMVRGSARHLLDLINDILDISKIEAGQLQIMSEMFGLRKSIEKAVQIILPLAYKKNLRLHFKIGDDVSEMSGDQRRVEQIMINLLSNAVKFTDNGEIIFSCDAGKDSITLSVEDTGIGIKPENLSMIFDAFRQVDTGIARVQEGTGLGLNITKKLVEMMGGSIHVESEMGKGSTFTVILPKSRA